MTKDLLKEYLVDWITVWIWSPGYPHDTFTLAEFLADKILDKSIAPRDLLKKLEKKKANIKGYIDS